MLSGAWPTPFVLKINLVPAVHYGTSSVSRILDLVSSAFRTRSSTLPITRWGFRGGVSLICQHSRSMVRTGSGSLVHTNAQSVSHHNVFCVSPHPLHLYCTRTWPGGANTRFGVPHFPHFASMRVCPCLTLTVFRSNASFTKRSISSRIACFDISRPFASILKVLTCSRGRRQRSRPGPGRKALWFSNRN